jgi:hypothetical protein
MMNKRNIFILGITIISLFIGYSCNEEFLNRTPKDSPNPGNFLINETSAKQLVIASYKPWVESSNMHFKELIIFADCLTDDADIRLNGSTRIQGRNWDFLPDHQFMADWWRYPYQSINAANYAIENIPLLVENGVAQEKLDPLVAEARFMRSYSYLWLVTFYGEVPLITEPLASFEEFSQPRSSKESIYVLMISDFSYAKEKLTEDGGGYEGTPTKATAAAFLAKAYLYKKDFVNAESAAREAISIAESSGYRLVDDYESIFDVENEANPELLFYFAFARNDAIYSTTAMVERLVRDLPGQLYHIQGSEGWGYTLPSRDLYDAFEVNDPRRGYTIFAPGDMFGIYSNPEPFTYVHRTYNEQGELVSFEKTYSAGDTVEYDYRWSPTGMNVKKATENLAGLTDIRYGGLDQIAMRMADLYLILAEALAEQGMEEALTWVNKVRARPSVNMPPKTTNDGSLLDIVKHERRVELAMEGQRIFDLMRWNNVKEVFGDGQKVKLHFFSDYLTDLSNRFMNPTTGLSKYPSDETLFPIPQYELDQNSEINSNNPGY